MPVDFEDPNTWPRDVLIERMRRAKVLLLRAVSAPPQLPYCWQDDVIQFLAEIKDDAEKR